MGCWPLDNRLRLQMVSGRSVQNLLIISFGRVTATHTRELRRAGGHRRPHHLSRPNDVTEIRVSVVEFG